MGRENLLVEWLKLHALIAAEKGDGILEDDLREAVRELETRTKSDRCETCGDLATQWDYDQRAYFCDRDVQQADFTVPHDSPKAKSTEFFYYLLTVRAALSPREKKKEE